MNRPSTAPQAKSHRVLEGLIHKGCAAEYISNRRRIESRTGVWPGRTPRWSLRAMKAAVPMRTQWPKGSHWKLAPADRSHKGNESNLAFSNRHHAVSVNSSSHKAQAWKLLQLSHRAHRRHAVGLSVQVLPARRRPLKPPKAALYL